MQREYNRFNWIACAWILIGLFDFPLGFFVYAWFSSTHIDNVDHLVVVKICGIVGWLCCMGWMTVSIQLNSRYWTYLNWIGILAIVWGSLHAVFAVFVFFNSRLAVGGMPPIAVVFNLLLSAISLFLILSGIYVLRKTDLYLQFRWRD